jgi:hypothetical protein
MISAPARNMGIVNAAKRKNNKNSTRLNTLLNKFLTVSNIANTQLFMLRIRQIGKSKLRTTDTLWGKGEIEHKICMLPYTLYYGLTSFEFGDLFRYSRSTIDTNCPGTCKNHTYIKTKKIKKDKMYNILRMKLLTYSFAEFSALLSNLQTQFPAKNQSVKYTQTRLLRVQNRWLTMM